MGVVSLNEITPVSVWKWVCRRIFTHPDTVTHPMEKALMLKLVLGLSLIRPSATVIDPYVFQCLSISENFKSIQVLKLSWKTSFEILSDAFDPLEMILSVSERNTQSVRVLVMVLGTAATFLSFYILCKIVHHSYWLVSLLAF